MMKNVTLQYLKRVNYKGAQMGPWDFPSHLITPFHGNDRLRDAIQLYCVYSQGKY